jgi:hypothetical protein
VRTHRAWPRVCNHDRSQDYAQKVLVNRHRSQLRRGLVEARHAARLGPPGASRTRGRR